MNISTQTDTLIYKKRLLSYQIFESIFAYTLLFSIIAQCINPVLFNPTFNLIIPKVVIFLLFGFIRIVLGARINQKYLFFLLALIPSIVFNDINPIFHPWERYLYFVILIIGIGPFLVDNQGMTMIVSLWKDLHLFLFLITVLSLIYHFVDYSSTVHGTGYVMGIMNHSMILSPISALSAFYSFCGLINNSASTKVQKAKYFISFLLAVYVVLISASRAALFALIISICLYVMKTKYVKTFLGLIFVIAICVSIFNKDNLLFSAISSKFEADNDRSSSLFVSREYLWQNRFNELKTSPIFGIGFATIDINDPKCNLDVNSIEPGNSWFFALSSTGLVGFLSLLYIIFSVITRLYERADRNSECNLLLCTIVFFGIHMIAEGYIFSAGNPLACLFWMSIMISEDFLQRCEQLSITTIE